MTLFAPVIYAQELTKEELKAQRKAEKLDRKRAELEKFKEYKLWIDSAFFGVAADMILDRSLNRITLNPRSNFIQINGGKCIIQLNGFAAGGANGIGGRTIEGNITSYEVDQSKEHTPITVAVQMQSISLGLTSFMFTVNKDGSSRVTVSGWGGRSLTYNGRIYNPQEYRVNMGAKDF
ncbi:MAG: DUF4251 domain-containing protein [Cyclobacteriaceae bacterium]